MKLSPLIQEWLNALTLEMTVLLTPAKKKEKQNLDHLQM